MRKFLKFLLPSCFNEPNKHQSRNSKPRITSQASPDIRRLSCYDIDTPEDLSSSVIGSNVYMFKLDELKIVTKGFSTSNMIGQGGFGPVYKGFVDERIRPGIKPQAVAVKILDLEGMQGHKQWLAEVIYLGQLSHPNLVKLVGYCYEKEHRVLVYEFMENGSMENHLYNSIIGPLPWLVRVKIALGAAKGLAFLHEQDKPVIYRDFKASNILLDKDYNAKLSDLGLAKDGPEGDFSHVSTQVMGTEGYCAPEYVMTGHLTTRSDVYSFGVVLLELLTGRRSVDKHRPTREQSLVSWAKPYLRNPEKLCRIMDTRLDGQYSTLGAQKAADIAYKCLSSNQKLRPLMREVVQSLEIILNYKDIPIGPFVFTVVQDDGNKTEEEVEKRNGNSHHDVRHKMRFPDSTISGMGMEREKMRYNKGRAR